MNFNSSTRANNRCAYIYICVRLFFFIPLSIVRHLRERLGCGGIGDVWSEKKYIALASAVSFGVRIRCQVMQPLRDMHLNLDGTTAVSTIAYCKRCDMLVFKRRVPPEKLAAETCYIFDRTRILPYRSIQRRSPDTYIKT